MIDRGPGFDANWLDLDTDLTTATPTFGLDLVTDFLGIDTRLANDGNGDYDGTVGLPTSMHLSLSGLPANTYDWTSIHIDTEHVYGEFLVNISTDGGSTFSPLPNGIMADATPEGNPDSIATGFFDTQVQDSVAAHEVGAVYSATFTADGTSDVVFEFIPLSEQAVHRQIWGINGFILEESGGGGPLVNGDFNGDGNWNCQDINALTTAISASSSDLSFDMNGDGTIDISDITDVADGWLTAGGANNTSETGGNAFLSGDANLDGVVDVADFNIWNGNKFTGSSNWCDGDFTADGSVDVSDFNLWNGAKFTSSDSVAAVPEPGSLVMLMIGLVFVSCRTRKSRS